MSEEQTLEEKLSLPEGTKVIIPPEKVSEKKKKERSEAQKAAFEKMRAKRLENDQKRKLSKEEKQIEIDNIKIQQEKEEEEERLKRADELKQKLGVNVEVLQKRGRKPGQHIPYKKEEKVEKIEVKREEPQPPVYTNPYMTMLMNKMRR